LNRKYFNTWVENKHEVIETSNVVAYREFSVI